MPGVDFEHESRIAESVVRPRGGRPGRLVGILLTGCAIAALGYAWYVSTLGPRNAPKNNNEAFNTARAGVTLGFDAPEPKGRQPAETTACAGAGCRPANRRPACAPADAGRGR